MSYRLVCMLIGVTIFCDPAEAQTAAAKPIVTGLVKWWTKPGAKPSPYTRTTRPSTKSNLPDLPKPAAPASSDKNNVAKPIDPKPSWTAEVATGLKKHNAKETVKCVLKEQRLPDGAIVRICVPDNRDTRTKK